MSEAKHTAWHINDVRTVEGEMMICAGEGHGYGLIAAVTMPEDAQSIVRDHNDRPALLARLASLEADNARLREALTGLSNMYGSAWDRVDGGLMMMGTGIERFEKTHHAAQIALGTAPSEADENDESQAQEQAR